MTDTDIPDAATPMTNDPATIAGRLKGSITASCGHVLADDEDAVPVEFETETETCDAIEGFVPTTVYASYCPACAAKLQGTPMTKTDETRPLAACDLCGCSVEFEYHCRAVYAQCQNDDCEQSGPLAWTEAEAAILWNQRQPAATDAAVDGVVEADEIADDIEALFSEATNNPCTCNIDENACPYCNAWGRAKSAATLLLRAALRSPPAGDAAKPHAADVVERKAIEIAMQDTLTRPEQWTDDDYTTPEDRDEYRRQAFAALTPTPPATESDVTVLREALVEIANLLGTARQPIPDRVKALEVARKALGETA